MSLATAFTVVFQPDRPETREEIEEARAQERHDAASPHPIEIRTIGLGELRGALMGGVDDLRHCRTETITIAVIYPLCGLIVAGAIAWQAIDPLIFPLLSGFALIGPLATLWYAALSRHRERTGEAVAEEAIEIFHSPHGKALKRLGATAIALFLVWIAAAGAIYAFTLGTSHEAENAVFPVRVVTTGAGAEMIIIGCIVGAVFAVVAVAIGCVSFPLALDRQVTASEAIGISAKALLRNPVFMAAWGVVIVVSLIVGAIPALLGLAVVLPVLGHATWHIYRRIIV